MLQENGSIFRNFPTQDLGFSRFFRKLFDILDTLDMFLHMSGPTRTK